MTKDREKLIEILYSSMKPMLMRWIEISFKKYARAHGCSPANLQIEWDRYKKILEKTK